MPSTKSSSRNKKLSKAELDKVRRKARVAELRAKGKRTLEISEIVGININTVQFYLREIHQEYLERIREHADDIKADLIADLDFAQREYAEAWEQSKTELVVSRTDRRVGEGKTGSGKSVRYSTTTEKRIGDPRYLQGYERCVHKKAELTGIIEVKISIPKSEDNTITDNERDRILATAIAQAQARESVRSVDSEEETTEDTA